MRVISTGAIVRERAVACPDGISCVQRCDRLNPSGLQLTHRIQLRKKARIESGAMCGIFVPDQPVPKKKGASQNRIHSAEKILLDSLIPCHPRKVLARVSQRTRVWPT